MGRAIVKDHREFLIQYPKQPDNAARLALAADFGYLHGDRVLWDGLPFGIRSGTDISLFHLRGVSFDHTLRLTDCTGSGAIFEQCVFDQGSIEATPGHKVSWEGVTFRKCKFHGTTFGPATLSLRRASFESSSLRHVLFRNGRLAEACFDHCLLHDCALRSAVLTDATFRGADLRKVAFERTPLTGVDFSGAQFHQMDFYGPLDLTPCRALPSNA
jgi:uncharacterized protein YjbI with pentapeptide repeats